MTRLGVLGNITSRAMFGGVGLHWRDVIFGIVFQDRLHLKLYDQSRPEHERRGMGPFRPNERQNPQGVLRGALRSGSAALLGQGGEPPRDGLIASRDV